MLTNYLVRRGSEAAQPGDHVSVDLPCVCLPRHNEAAGEARLGRHQPVEALHLLVVAVKPEGRAHVYNQCTVHKIGSCSQLEEGGLGPRGPLHPPEPQPVPGRPQVLLVHDQLLEPETRPLANCCQLGRLEVGEAQGRQVLVLPGKVAQPRDDPG